ncbi:MAG: DUF4345 domain-containing protein [Bacteroidota bacterium]
MQAKEDFVNKIHLLISVVVVVPAGLIYGFRPELLLNISVQTLDEHSFHKAVMTLYFGFAGLWILGILKHTYLRAALISNVIFMLGLASGRILSMIFDGMPSSVYVFGTIGELLLGFYGLWVLNSNAYSKIS